jgi:hypothetical protein
MLFNVAAFALAAQVAAAEDYQIVGSFIFGRHNDRESKPATVLTSIGAHNQFLVGQFYRERYFGIDSEGTRNDSSATLIQGLNEDGVYVNGQIYAEAPYSNVMLFSHYSFLQGLYPPIDIANTTLIDSFMSELANGTVIENPLNGYQYIQSYIQENATEGYIRIKGDENCPALTKSLQQTQKGDLFEQYTSESSEFLQSLYEYEFIKEKFKQSELTFSNSMNIYDQVYVNSIHNATVAKEIDEDIITEIKIWSDLYQWTLSDKHVNSNLTIGAQTLMGSILNRLNTTKTSRQPLLNYYTGSFNTMFQLASVLDLEIQDDRFKTMPEYGCTYVFELLSDSDDDIFVRFSFKNGTAEMGDEITAYPLFNTSDVLMSWDDFAQNVKSLAISEVSSWCDACGYEVVDADQVLDMCVPYGNLYETAKQLDAEGVNLSSVKASSSKSSSLTLADAGGIGAGVTIGVFLILGALYFLYMKTTRKQKHILPVTKDNSSIVTSGMGSTVASA